MRLLTRITNTDMEMPTPTWPLGHKTSTLLLKPITMVMAKPLPTVTSTATGDATSDSRNGYQDADTVGVGWIKHAVPRRSSLKPSSSAASVGGMTITSHRKKRATMSFGSSVEPTEFKKRLSVGFSSCLQINEAAPSQDYLTTADLQYIEKQNAKIVKYTLKGGTDKHFCTRGLEDQIQHTSQHRKAALQAVFEEQTKMKEEEGYC